MCSQFNSFKFSIIFIVALLAAGCETIPNTGTPALVENGQIHEAPKVEDPCSKCTCKESPVMADANPPARYRVDPPTIPQNDDNPDEIVVIDEQRDPIENKAMYTLGNNLGLKTAKSAWSNLGQKCDQAPKFFKIVDDSITKVRKQYISKYKVITEKEAFARGYIAGLSSITDIIIKKCSNLATEYSTRGANWKKQLLTQ